MKEKLNNMPMWLINSITVISGIITIATSVGGIIILSNDSDFSQNTYYIITIIVVVAFCIILYFRARKYRKIASNRMSKTSYNYHKLLHEARNTYFEVMQRYKKGSLTIDGLSATYKSKLSAALDNLCDIMESFTGRKVSACIKLISYVEKEEIVEENIALVTFCRSNNSDTGRQNYEM